ncbi:MAG: hypothetical protein LBB36_07225, partial [Fibromonadaceae bacterium]|jgi:hypothetical protein|nr:hypothetical protein [Fibromonadaceae bacterium]
VLDNEGDSIIFSYTMDKYTEKLSGKIFQIPIMLKYSNHLYYTAAGIKIGAVRNASVNASYKGLVTEGYYPEYYLSLPEPIFQGLGKQKDSSFKTKINSKTLIMLALEGGVKFKAGDNFALLAGVFADYSFNRGFDRKLPPVIERVEYPGEARLVASDTWKSWHPWSVGAMVKLSFGYKPDKEYLPPDPVEEIKHAEPDTHSIVVMPDTMPPQPVPVIVMEEPPALPQVTDSFQIPPLPDFLMNREADFIFHYPETRTSPTDSLHLALISQMADSIRATPNSQLHCVGYSEKLTSESVAYETALQRVIRIRYTITHFYGIEASRIFIYSQGSKNSGYRRAECFLL